MDEEEYLDRLRHYNAVQAFMEEDNQDWIAQSNQRWDDHIRQELIRDATPLQMIVTSGQTLEPVAQRFRLPPLVTLTN